MLTIMHADFARGLVAKKLEEVEKSKELDDILLFAKQKIESIAKDGYSMAFFNDPFKDFYGTLLYHAFVSAIKNSGYRWDHGATDDYGRIMW